MEFKQAVTTLANNPILYKKLGNAAGKLGQYDADFKNVKAGDILKRMGALKMAKASRQSAQI